ncbi:hypothetical protein HYV85_03245 [Candidatus Woesearchaeota archaeon]|nr:hypothetical protein [Candidatus Woesearchaeota archaeon]
MGDTIEAKVDAEAAALMNAYRVLDEQGLIEPLKRVFNRDNCRSLETAIAAVNGSIGDLAQIAVKANSPLSDIIEALFAYNEIPFSTYLAAVVALTAVSKAETWDVGYSATDAFLSTLINTSEIRGGAVDRYLAQEIVAKKSLGDGVFSMQKAAGMTDGGGGKLTADKAVEMSGLLEKANASLEQCVAQIAEAGKWLRYCVGKGLITGQLLATYTEQCILTHEAATSLKGAVGTYKLRADSMERA